MSWKPACEETVRGCLDEVNGIPACRELKGGWRMDYAGLNQLLCAAVINNRFREKLLKNPAQAVASGYYGHTFSLSNEEHALVADIKAQYLEDFAAQVHAWLVGRFRSRYPPSS